MATEANVISVVAERYASAVYELADEARVLDGTADDLKSLQAMLRDSADLQMLIRSPLIDAGDKAAAMGSILEQAGASDLTRRFIAVIARNNRLFVLPATIEAFLTELAHRRGEVTAEVTSAQPLKQLQLESVTNALRGALGGKVTVDAKLDPSLIGGLVVRVGSRMIDASLKSKLQRLQLAMKGAQ
ncbi:MAG: F-type H+-transporting ATPase subunit delta [Alphaproteobacteria bacterium]